MAKPFSPKFIAQKTFTNREDSKKILRLSIETKQKFDEYRIKVFYGVGGQGKSYLKNSFLVTEYLKPIAEKDKNLIYCDTIDFEKDESKRQPDEALLAIAKTLIEKGNFALPAFALGFLKYKNLSSTSSNLVQDYPFLFKLSGKMIAGSPLTNEILAEVVNFGAASLPYNIPFLGFFIKKMVDKGKDKIIEWIRKSDANEILADLDELDKFSLLERLPKLLAYDVFKTLENDYKENGKQGKRIVIILDGYETLWQNSKNDDINKDKWIRNLAYNMPGVLFVIFGRDKLRWAEIERDDEFITAIDQHLIKGLSDNDADAYLKFVPIQDAEIRNSIIRNSKGGNSEEGCLPLYLDIEVNTYEQIVNKRGEPSKKDFEQGNEKTELEIVNRFFKHISPELSNAISVLSLSNYFDDDIIQLLKKSSFLPPRISLNELDDFSFIYIENNKATIHGLVREIASEQYKKNFSLDYFKIHETLFNYFNNQLPSFKAEEITPQIEAILANAAQHKEIYDARNFSSWILEKSYYLYGIGYYDTLHTQLKHALELIENSVKNNSTDSKEDQILIGKLYYQLAYNDNYAGKSLSAGKYIRRALDVYKIIFPESFFNQFPKTGAEQEVTPEIRSLIEHFKIALELTASIEAEMGKNNECGKLYDQANNIANQFNLSFDEYGFAAYLKNVGRLAEAEPYLFKQYNLHVRNNDLLSAALAAHDFAKLLKAQERFEEAILYEKIAIDIYTRLKTKNHAHTGVAMQSLAAILIKQGKDLIQAELLLNEVWDIYMKNYRDDHINFGYLYQVMFLLSLKKDVNKALHYFNKAKEIFSHNTGEMNASYIIMLIDIAEQLKSAPINISDEYTPKIINYFLNDFEKLKELLGIYNDALHRGLEITAAHFEETDKKEIAETFRKRKEEFLRILKIRTQIRTENLNITTIPSPEKENILIEFKKVTSLPSDTTSVKLERITQSFYKTYNLYRISFLNSEKIFYKYVLYNDVEPIAVDWNSIPIHQVNSSDINLTKDSIIAYTLFFCDCLSSNRGKFYIISNENDIPWQVDVKIDENLKLAVRNEITPVRVISENDNAFTIEAFMLYENIIYKVIMEVNKYKGEVSMSEDRRMHIYKSKNNFTCTFNPEEIKTQIENLVELNGLPCCIDPLYGATSYK